MTQKCRSGPMPIFGGLCHPGKNVLSVLSSWVPSRGAIIAFWHCIKKHLIILSSGSSVNLESADQPSLPLVDTAD